MFNYQNAIDVNLTEVGPRDGLQNISTMVSTEDKLEYIRLLALSPFKGIEVTSFVSPKAIPQMGDSVELYQELMNKKYQGDFLALVPNLMGLQNALKVNCQHLAIFTTTSETFAKKNINCSIDESYLRFKELIDYLKLNLKENFSQIKIRGYLSTVFGCPYEGQTTIKQVMSGIERLLDLGVYEVSLGDTIGIAHPKQVMEIGQMIKSQFPMNKIAMHFHDTRGMAISNILTSLELGVRSFDAASAGLGGCPYAKGSSGNVATEDVLFLLNSLGLKTGIELNKVYQASKFILSKLPITSPSKVYQSLKALDQSI